MDAGKISAAIIPTAAACVLLGGTFLVTSCVQRGQSITETITRTCAEQGGTAVQLRQDSYPSCIMMQSRPTRTPTP